MATIIRTEATPNPNALKFVLDATVLYSGSRSFNETAQAAGDPIASALFTIDGVTSVYYMKDFVTVTKDETRSWREIALKVYEQVPTLDLAALVQEVEAVKQSSGHGDFDTLSQDDKLARINEVLDRDIRPGLAMDGGGLQIKALDGYRVSIH